MSERDATQLTEKIRITAHNYADARQKLQQYVAEAKSGNAHLALGYASWTAYLAEVLGEEPMRLARGERQEMVQMLSAEGMSTRAIAPIVGASFKTVARDIEPSVSNDTDEPRTVESMDGITRTFQPRAEQAQRPDPLPAQFTAAVSDLARVLDRLHRLSTHENYQRNTESISVLHKHDIIRAITELQAIANTL